MANLTIRNVDDQLKTLLRIQAAQHGRSMEQEVREILRLAVSPAQSPGSFAERIRQRFAGLGAEAIVMPARRAARIPGSSKNRR